MFVFGRHSIITGFQGLKALTISRAPFYSRQKLWSLYLMCAFPLHIWTIILAFRDISWVSERTNMWDAIGVVSYGLLFAFIESLLLFFVVALIGAFVSRFWNNDRLLVLLSVLVLVVAIWSMLSQIYFLADLPFLTKWNQFLAHSNHPARIKYAILIPLMSLSVLLPAWLIIKSEKGLAFFHGLIERVTLLTIFYLVFDIIGLIIIIVRNF